jgi:hypothetical protein
MDDSQRFHRLALRAEELGLSLLREGKRFALVCRDEKEAVAGSLDDVERALEEIETRRRNEAKKGGGSP